MSAEFDTAADRRAYALVAAGAAALSYDHARAFFLPFMGTVGASVTPLMLDAVVFWLASANVRQARGGPPAADAPRRGVRPARRWPSPPTRSAAATWPERVFLALPAALFGFLVEARTRLALYHHRAEHGDRPAAAAAVGPAPGPRPSGRGCGWPASPRPAFDRASAERDRLRAARDAVRLALPGRARDGPPRPRRGAARAERRAAGPRRRGGRLRAAGPGPACPSCTAPRWPPRSAAPPPQPDRPRDTARR